jgi:glycogen debranching enzyme
VKDDNALLAVDLTNPDFTMDGHVVVPRGSLHIFRTKFLWQGTCYERLRIYNNGLVAVDVPLSLQLDADFADIFEVRGLRRRRRGYELEAIVKHDGIMLGYAGLDGVTRRTVLHCSPPAVEASGSDLRLEIQLPPKGEATFELTISCESAGPVPSRVAFDHALLAAADALKRAKSQDCEIYTSNEQFNDWINRSIADLHCMITDTPHGPYPYAGVPWFSTAFGRDGIITALECLWINPEIARGVLRYLAEVQASEVLPAQDAEPGKILHEARLEELAALGEIPFRQYYGSVDATPALRHPGGGLPRAHRGCGVYRIDLAQHRVGIAVDRPVRRCRRRWVCRIRSTLA